MSKSSFFALITTRLRQKIMGILPIVIGAMILLALITLTMYIVSPWLPADFKHFIDQLQNADWAGGRDSVARFFDGFGPAKPYIFIAAQVLQVIVAPIPGQFVGLLGGYLFGFWYGLFITMVGLMLGSWIAMGIGRLLGKGVVRKIVPQSIMKKFDFVLSEGGLWNFFLLFLLPALPDDAICFMAGLSRLRMWQLLAVCFLGRLPGMAVLTFVGASVGSTNVLANVVLAIGIIIAFVMWLFSEEMEAFFYRLGKSMSKQRF